MFTHRFVLSRSGCKIKALRAKTNTYIKTPVRGEEPVFIITGRPEDVSVAKKEILQAAEHFSQIRASRRSSSVSPPNVGSTPAGAGEKITIFVRVPYRVVGLVVGPKGATVKRIQQNTGTYIITPSRDMEPYFEVRGTPENVELAKKEIESYIALRTGGVDQLLSPMGGTGSFESENGLSMRRNVRRTMSVSDPTNILHHPASMVPTTPTIPEAGRGGKLEQRSSPLSSAVFSPASFYGPGDDEIHHTVPMSAPALAFDKVFDFGGNKVKQMSSNWSPQPTSTSAHHQVQNGSWGSHLYNKATSPQPPSPSGSWGKLSPQPPSPTGSWGSNSSEGNAVMSPRGCPNTSGGFMSPQSYSPLSRLGLMQQLHNKTNALNGFINNGGLCCRCEESEADTILIPCGHKSTCFDCACKMSTIAAFCPSCNTKIESLAQQQFRL